MTKRNNNHGFTLLEVMIALAVAAIGLTAILSLGISSIKTGERIERTTQAVLLAQGLLAAFESGALPLPQEGEKGRFDPPDDGFRWEIRYQGTPIDGLRQLTVSVLWEGAPPEAAMTLDSYVLQ